MHPSRQYHLPANTPALVLPCAVRIQPSLAAYSTKSAATSTWIKRTYNRTRAEVSHMGSLLRALEEIKDMNGHRTHADQAEHIEHELPPLVGLGPVAVFRYRQQGSLARWILRLDALATETTPAIDGEQLGLAVGRNITESLEVDMKVLPLPPRQSDSGRYSHRVLIIRETCSPLAGCTPAWTPQATVEQDIASSQQLPTARSRPTSALRRKRNTRSRRRIPKRSLRIPVDVVVPVFYHMHYPALLSPSWASHPGAILDHAIRSNVKPEDALIYTEHARPRTPRSSRRFSLAAIICLSAMSSFSPSLLPPLPPSSQASPQSSASASSSVLVRQASQLSTSAVVNALPSSSNGAPAIDGMANSKLPIDVCERIIDDVYNVTQEPWRCYELLACALTCKAWTPRSLYVLYSYVKEDAAMFPGFPPAGLFGPFVTDLCITLHFSFTSTISDTVMKYIGTLQELDTLSFEFPLYRSNEYILDSLLSLPSSDLKVSSFSLKVIMFRHEHTRSHFLAHLWPVLQHIRKIYPCLEQLHLTLKDNHPVFNGHWWCNKILDQLPSLIGVLKCKVTIDTFASQHPYDDHKWWIRDETEDYTCWNYTIIEDGLPVLWWFFNGQAEALLPFQTLPNNEISDEYFPKYYLDHLNSILPLPPLL
ncbi:hypothetical protein ONZ51_g13 [Trametes cubensis]|uniref:Uncharacterized protein n=1 Tax=Trametes cubensis TaxID=1111947 RepID=A0AAD7XEA6_9APHY|nr:hypothetical protein ONZ51_g13 [Trametes cubensis]